MEMLQPGVYSSALTWTGKSEVWSDMVSFTADRSGQYEGMVHGAGETDPDGRKRRLTLWLGKTGVEGTWLQHTIDGHSFDQGTVEFEPLGDRWHGLWWTGEREKFGGLWVLSLIRAQSEGGSLVPFD